MVNKAMARVELGIDDRDLRKRFDFAIGRHVE
jgi:hypothetical protein